MVSKWLSPDFLFDSKEQKCNYSVEKLDNTLAAWSKLTSPIRGRQTLWHHEKDTDHLWECKTRI